MKQCFLLGVLLQCSCLAAYQLFSSGCAKSSPAFQLVNDSVHGCPGYWAGHIQESGHLCSSGWHICSWKDREILKNIMWKDAMNIAGCYAYNAAQDGATCRPCVEDVQADDLAGVGRGCPHQLLGQRSCISGGQISASCCVDSHFGKACTYRPNLTSGVVCCRTTGFQPRRHGSHQMKIMVTVGQPITVRCPVRGHPRPLITWYRNDEAIDQPDSEWSVDDAGSLMTKSAILSHSGLYRCRARNDLGELEVFTMVTVKRAHSGCRHNASEGLHSLPDIRSCRGSWEGHIHRANKLCAIGWRVCISRDVDRIRSITSSLTEGCFALDISPQYGCGKCRSRGFTMAGIGKNCPRQDPDTSSLCLRNVIMEIRRARHHHNCVYLANVTSGVLCCRL